MEIKRVKRTPQYKKQTRVLAYFFRHIGDDGQPTGWSGIVAGKTPHEVLWALDEHGDPYSMLSRPM
jgi:hypothetical protein